jgi:hypothetical protein
LLQGLGILRDGSGKGREEKDWSEMIERLWLSPDGDGGNGGGGASAAAATTVTAPVVTQGEGTHAGVPQQQSTAAQTPQTFTQADVDRIVGERAKRAAQSAEQSAIGELLKGLGLEKVEDLKALVDGARKSQEANLSESDKAQRKIVGLEKAIEMAKAEAKAAIEAAAVEKAAANEKLLKASVLGAAQSIGFVDPADAWLFLDRGKVQADESGNFVGVEELLKEIAKAKPHLVKPQSAGALGAVPSPRGNGAKTPVEAEQDVSEFAAIYGLNPKYLKKG